MSQEKIDSIVAEFRKEQDISDEEVESVLELCKRKMELTGKAEDYLELLLPDELKNHCFRRAANAISIFILKERRAECALCAE